MTVTVEANMEPNWVDFSLREQLMSIGLSVYLWICKKKVYFMY